MDPGSAFYDHFRGGEAPSEVVLVCGSRIKDQVAMAMAKTCLSVVRFCEKTFFNLPKLRLGQKAQLTKTYGPMGTLVTSQMVVPQVLVSRKKERGQRKTKTRS